MEKKRNRPVASLVKKKMMNDTGGWNKMQSYQEMSKKEELYKVKEGLEKSMQNTREWVFL